jgi:glycine dehydrogenase subunit 2
MTEPTIYELSSPGRIGVRFPAVDVPLSPLPGGLLRDNLAFPEIAEVDVVRHFTRLSRLITASTRGFTH